MNNILVPFDFSHNSRKALEFGAQLAKKTDATLIIFHAYDRSEVLEGVKVATTIHAMEDTRAKISKQFGLALDRVEQQVLQGEFVEEVLEFVETRKVDLLVVGTRGAGGLKELFVGSRTVSLMQEIKVPMLVIPEGAKYGLVRNILLCTDLHEIADDDALNLIKEIAIIYGSTIRLAHVEKRSGETSFEEILEKKREAHVFEPEVKCVYKRIVSPDVVEGIKYYMDQKGDNDMVAMIYRRHTFIDLILGTNHTHQMAYNTDVPLLVLPEVKG
ncbi:universal stress protein [Bacteroidota bacterium]